MTIEHRLAQEFRVAGRTLSGAAMVYGDTSPGFRERFVPGAFGAVPATIAVNLQHDAAIVVAERAVLADSPRALHVRADLPGPERDCGAGSGGRTLRGGVRRGDGDPGQSDDRGIDAIVPGAHCPRLDPARRVRPPDPNRGRHGALAADRKLGRARAGR